MKKMTRFLFFLVMIPIALYAGVSLYFNQPLNLHKETLIEVQKGSSLTSVAHELSRHNIISYPSLWAKIGPYYFYGSSIKYGEYIFRPGETYSDALLKLFHGLVKTYKVTFIEGEHMYQYAKRIGKSGLCSEKEFLTLARQASLAKRLIGKEVNSLEGYLFPDTYHFSKADGCKKIISTMVKRFNRVFRSLTGGSLAGGSLRGGASAGGSLGSGFSPSAMVNLNPHQLVTLASIVEKETGVPFERPLISSVFHNRLKKRMRLQTDPTVIYGILKETGKEIRNIRKKDLKNPTAYNTYLIRGLPPGPIGNPGVKALEAALKPKQTDYLYFVSRNDGTHVFSKTYKKHLKAVRKFQLDPKMRQNRSWRERHRKKLQSQRGQK